MFVSQSLFYKLILPPHLNCYQEPNTCMILRKTKFLIYSNLNKTLFYNHSADYLFTQTFRASKAEF